MTIDRGSSTTVFLSKFYFLTFISMDPFSLYVLFSHFKPCDFLMGIFLLFLYMSCVHVHVHKTTCGPHHAKRARTTYFVHMMEVIKVRK